MILIGTQNYFDKLKESGLYVVIDTSSNYFGTGYKSISNKSAREFGEVLAAVGLAQNFAALRALATEGIQRGHMALHARQVAVAAGVPEKWLSSVVVQMVKEGNIHVERAVEIMEEWRSR